MGKRLYLDSNIYYNIWLNEYQGYLPVGYYAEKVKDRIISEDYELVTSDLVVYKPQKSTALPKHS